MKKRFTWPLALLLILLGAGLAWADQADDIRRALDGLPAHMNVKYEDVKTTGSTVVVSGLSMRGYPGSLEDGRAERDGYFETTIKTLEITNFNAAAFDDPNPSLLAERIVAKDIKTVYSEDGGIFTMKQFTMDNPLAPWANLSQLKDKGEDEIWRQLAYVRIGAFSMENMEAYNPDTHDIERISVDRLSAQNLSLLYCTDMHMYNFKITEPDDRNKNRGFSISDIRINYNFYEYLLPLVMKPDFSLADIYSLDPTNKYDYKIIVSSIKSNLGFPFTIKSISCTQDNHDNFNGRFNLDAFRVESKDIRSFSYWGEGLNKHLLKGKPFLFSMDIKSSINVDKFLPSYVKVQMPGIANLDFDANMALKPDYLENLNLDSADVMELMFDFDEQMRWIMKNALLQDLALTYQDKGLINGIISYWAESDQTTKAKAKSQILAELDRTIQRNQPGLEQDFMKNLKSLIQKPGTLVFSMTPDKPVDLSELVDMVSMNPERIKYKFKLK